MKECISRVEGMIKKGSDWLMSFPLIYYTDTKHRNIPRKPNSIEEVASVVEVNRIEFEVIRKQGLSKDL